MFAAVVIVLIIIIAVYLWKKKVECKCKTKCALRTKMHRLWFDHVDRTNLFIVSTLENLPDAAIVAAHLQENQDDIAAAIGQVYGSAAATSLAALLHEHIDIAGKLVAAYKMPGSKQQTTALSAAWYTNADKIAAFLAAANKRWPLDAASTMMRAHLDTTAAYLTARLERDWKKASMLHDQVVDQAIHMADVLTDGIM
jgi:hypothetical protein